MIEKLIDIEIIKGVEGLAVVIGGFRVAGAKPYGGGEVIAHFKTPLDYIKSALVNGKIEEEGKHE